MYKLCVFAGTSEGRELVGWLSCQKNVSVTRLNEMLRLMDCKIVVVPRDSRVPEGGFEIE